MALSFDLDAATVLVHEAETHRLRDEDENEGEDTEDGPTFTEEGAEPVVAVAIRPGAKITRPLDRVRITRVALVGGETFGSGRCSILYRANGTCKPYTVMVTDEQGQSIHIEVDALSSASTGSG